MHDVIFFVLGYYIFLASNCVLIYKITKQKSIYGLSVDTQLCFLFSVLSRCCWTLDTRLVETKFAYFELAGALVVSFAICFLCYRYRSTMSTQTTPFRIYFLVPLALVAGIIIHPGDDMWTIQILVAFTMYIEAFGLLPQLWLMRKMHEVETLTSHYLALLIVARACRMIFWAILFLGGEHFWMLFIADIIHLLLAADYMFLYFKSIKQGSALVYSSSTNV